MTGTVVSFADPTPEKCGLQLTPRVSVSKYCPTVNPSYLSLEASFGYYVGRFLAVILRKFNKFGEICIVR